MSNMISKGLNKDMSQDQMISELLDQNLLLAQQLEELTNEVHQYRKVADFANRVAQNALVSKRMIANSRHTIYQMMKELHEKFGLPVRKSSDFHEVSSDERRSCIAILTEEYNEYLAAEATNDLIGIADAMGDMSVVIANTCLKYGINLDAVLEEIHSSNMSKLGTDGKPVAHPSIPGKFGKGPNYFKPNLYKVIYG